MLHGSVVILLKLSYNEINRTGEGVLHLERQKTILSNSKMKAPFVKILIFNKRTLVLLPLFNLGKIILASPFGKLNSETLFFNKAEQNKIKNILNARFFENIITQN